MKKWSILAGTLLLPLIFSAASQPLVTKPATSTSPVKNNAAKTEKKQLWNLQDADIKAVIQTVSQITGKNFIVDPRVQGKVTVVSTKPMSDSEIYQVFLSMLQVLNYSAVPGDDGVVKIVPSMAAKEEGGVLVNNKHPGSGDEVVVRVVEVNNISASELVPILRPLMHSWGSVTAYTPSNALIFAGTAANIKKLVEIVTEMDERNANGVSVLPLKHADATKMVSMIQQLHSEEKSQGRVENTALVADPENNSILISGNADNRAHMASLIESLDTEQENGSATTAVVHLNYLSAKEVAPILTNIVKGKLAAKAQAKGEEGSTSNSDGSASSSSVDSTDGKVSIQAEKSDNAIIINASASMMKNLKRVIKQIDVPPQQVLVEAVIVQLNEQVADQLGVVWGTKLDTGQSPDQEMSAAASGGLGAAGFIQGMGFIPGGNIKMLISALSQNTNANILSTPSVLVLNNQVASISDGETVSIINRSYQPNNNDDSNTPFNTLSRENIALTLKVTPQISPNNTVILKIDQKDNSLANPSNPGITPVENTNSIKTTVMVRSGDILVLGGLLKHDDSLGSSKVPILGDIPVLGNLFHFKNNSMQKNNLMVFIKPVILNNPADSKRETDKRYKYMRYQEQRFASGIRLTDHDEINPILPHRGAEKSVNLPAPF